jgi:hypothetical protein
VSGTTSHGEKKLIDGDSMNIAVEVSFSLDSELREVLSGGRYSQEVSVAISRGTRTPSRGGTTGNQGSTGLRLSGPGESLVPFVGWSLLMGWWFLCCGLCGRAVCVCSQGLFVMLWSSLHVVLRVFLWLRSTGLRISTYFSVLRVNSAESRRLDVQLWLIMWRFTCPRLLV